MLDLASIYLIFTRFIKLQHSNVEYPARKVNTINNI